MRLNPHAANSIVDGFNDNGIDAIYYSQISKTLFIIQSKWIHKGEGEPESGEVNKFVNGIRDIINSNYERFNQKVNRKKYLIESAISDFGTKIQLILIHTGKEKLSVHSQRLLDDLISDLNDIGEDKKADIASVQVFNQSKIYSSLAQSTDGEPITLDFSLSQWGK